MEIFQNALLWLLVFCMFVLLFRIKLEKNINEKLKNEIISLKSNHKKMQNAVSQQIQDLTNLRGSLILEKIELEKEKHNFKTDRKTYEKIFKNHLINYLDSQLIHWMKIFIKFQKIFICIQN